MHTMYWCFLLLFLFGFCRSKLYDGCSTDIPEMFDFVIVGGGTAGSVLANRLSEDPSLTVLVLEAGSKDRDIPESPYIQTPVLFSNLFHTDIMWKYKTERQSHALFGMPNNSYGVEMGRVLGGSSSVNGMLFERGFKTDFDSWAEGGAEGWSYEDVLPFLEKVDGIRNFSDDTVTTCGQVGLSGVERTPPGYLALSAAKEAGVTESNRQNPNPLGVSFAQLSITSGLRNSASKSYLWPVMYRPNLHVVTGAQVKKILIDHHTIRAEGVWYILEGSEKLARARQEVILSAGPYGSPKILMLSGIGPAVHLGDIGKSTLVDLPVGRNLEQHMYIKLPIHVDMPTLSRRNLSSDDVYRDYVFHRKGPLNGLVGIGDVNCYIQSENLKTGRDEPISNLVFVDGNTDSVLSDDFKGQCGGWVECSDEEELPPGPGIISVLVIDAKPKSRGYVRLRSADYTDLPLINPNFLSSRFDVKVFLESVRFVQEMLKTPSFRSVNARFPPPKPTCLWLSYDTDAYWECFIRHFAGPTYHGLATCRMGEGKNTVVDSRLRVKGVSGLRVVDASVIPSSPSTYLQATVYMLAEKAAHMIKEDMHSYNRK